MWGSNLQNVTVENTFIDLRKFLARNRQMKSLACTSLGLEVLVI